MHPPDPLRIYTSCDTPHYENFSAYPATDPARAKACPTCGSTPDGLPQPQAALGT